MWQIVLPVARAVLLVLTGFLVLLYACQPGMVYLPQREIVATPSAVGLRYEEVFFKTEDGVKLHGWLIPSNPEGVVLLFCHGNAGNISHRLQSIDIFHRLGLGVFIFDYRGYGLSEGNPTEEGTYRDAEGAWNYLIRERCLLPQTVWIFGRSLGGPIAAWLARDRDAGALLLESTFTSFKDIAGDIYPWLPARLLARYDYETVSHLSRVRCPVLVIHSAQDDLIPFRHGKELYAAAKEPKMFLEITGGHNDGFIWSGLRYEEGIKAFLTRCTGQTQQKRP